MAKQNLNIDNISINFSVTCTAEDGAPFSLSESDSLNFKDENELNRKLVDKPYLKDIVPFLVARMRGSFDPTNAQAKALKDSLS